MNTITIKPSAEARQIFNKMVARADGKDVSVGTLLSLSKEIDRENWSCVSELASEGWIKRADHGGIRIAL